MGENQYGEIGKLLIPMPSGRLMAEVATVPGQGFGKHHYSNCQMK